MRIAIVAATHGNELIGVDVVRHLNTYPLQGAHTYECFIANPRALAQKKRFIDYDLNRSFGKNHRSFGYESLRARELKRQISGRFDLLVDLHTSTSNMGLSLILNNSHSLSRKAALYLQDQFPEIRIIEESELDLETTHLGQLCPARVTIEVGPIANNVRNYHLTQQIIDLVSSLINGSWDSFATHKDVFIFKMREYVKYPDPKVWFIHPEFEGRDFELLRPGTPIFKNMIGGTWAWDKEATYPFFINEAAYQDLNHAFLTAEKVLAWPKPE